MPISASVPRHLLRETLVFQSYTRTKDSTGFDVPTYATLLTIKGAVQEQSGNEANEAGKDMATRQYNVYVATQDIDAVSARVTEQTRIKWIKNGVTRYMGIVNVRDYDSQRRLTCLTCVEQNVGIGQV